MRGRTRRTRREERERREEGRIEGDEAARTDGCCQGSAKKVHKIKGRTHRIAINPEKKMHIGEKFHVPAPFVAKTKTSSGLLNPKAFLLATLTLYLEKTRFKNIAQKSESVKLFLRK